MKQLVAQVIVALVVKQGALIIAAVFLLCQLLLNATQAVMSYAPCTVVKFLHFPYLFVQAIARLCVIICVPVTAVHNS